MVSFFLLILCIFSLIVNIFMLRTFQITALFLEDDARILSVNIGLNFHL